MDWFYSINNMQAGPVPDDELVALTKAGTISATTLVWHEGMADWQPLSVARPDLVAGTTASAPATKDYNVQAMREGANPSLDGTTLSYAGFWIRFAAKFIDGIAMQVVLLPLNLIFQASMMGMANTSSEPSSAAAGAAVVGFLILLVASIAVPLLYSGFMVGKFGATLGKMACGLRVVLPDGSKLSMGRSFGRAGAEIICNFTMGIGYLIAAFDDQKRALHDHIASTRVIKVR